jgi:hypothetical protein
MTKMKISTFFSTAFYQIMDTQDSRLKIDPRNFADINMNLYIS